MLLMSLIRKEHGYYRHVSLCGRFILSWWRLRSAGQDARKFSLTSIILRNARRPFVLHSFDTLTLKLQPDSQTGAKEGFHLFYFFKN